MSPLIILGTQWYILFNVTAGASALRRRTARYRAPTFASAARAHGLGAYIAGATEVGDYPRIVLGIAVMSLFVVIFNRAFWRPLYWRAERTFRLG